MENKKKNQKDINNKITEIYKKTTMYDERKKVIDLKIKEKKKWLEKEYWESIKPANPQRPFHVELLESENGFYKVNSYNFINVINIGKKGEDLTYYQCKTKKEAVHKEILKCYDEIDYCKTIIEKNKRIISEISKKVNFYIKEAKEEYKLKVEIENRKK